MSRAHIGPILRFINGTATNQWLTYGKFEIYVRRGYHCVDGKVAKTFDLANFENHGVKGKGKFRALIAVLCAILPEEFQHIYIESVLNERLAKSLPSMGFKMKEGDADSPAPSFYLTLNHNDK